MSTEALLKALAQRKASVSRIKTIKPKDGRNRYRLLPSWRNTGNAEFDAIFWQDFGQHFVKDAAGQVKAVYICTDKTFGRPCPICEMVARGIKNAPDQASLKLIKDAGANARVLVNALELDGQNPTEPQILELAPSVFNGKKGVGGIISLFNEWPTMLDPNTGHDIIVEKSGSGMDTSYGVQIAGGSKPVPPTVFEKNPDGTWKRLHDLDKFVQMESEQAQQRALASVSAIAGLPAPAVALPAPGVNAGDVPLQPIVPQPVAAPVVVDAAPVQAAPAPVAAPAVAPAAPVAPTPAPAAPAPVQATPVTPGTPPAAPAASAVISTGDPELDALLGNVPAPAAAAQ